MEEVEMFLSTGSGDGSGFGDGDGDGFGIGDGSGSGDGFGFGFGFGSGSGFGDGDGDGDGSGSGDGFGFGYCDGYGDGSGSGYCDGYGDGSGDNRGIAEINGYTIHLIDNIATVLYSIHGNYAKGATIKDNSILVDCYIAKLNGYFAHGETLRDAMRDAQAKYLQNSPIEERVKMVVGQYPDIDVPIANRDLYSLHNMLTGSCELGRKQFAESHNINLADSMTMREFINLTKSSYVGENIRLLAKEYGYNI